MRTNKYLTLLFLFAMGFFHSQLTNDEEKIKKSETTNSKEVFADIMQLALTNIAGKNKEFNFKANLFQLQAKADSTLLIDQNIRNYNFSRNFQLDLALKLEDDYKFSGFKAGFSYNIINKRDTVLFTITEELDDKFSNSLHQYFSDKLVKYTGNCKQTAGTNDEKLKKCAATNETIKEGFEKLRYDSTGFPDDFIESLGEEYTIARKKADEEFISQKEKYFARPILTLSANGNFGNEKHFLNGGDINLVYLQGIFKKKSRNEIDLRAGFSIKDTITTKQYFKKEFRTSVGINFSLLKAENQKSWLEFKPYAEYIRNFEDGPFENMETFNANADLRFRIFKDIWIPLIIKYDLKEGKFLGFLNIVFDWGYFSPKRE